MKINRLFEIVYILLDKKKVTAAELAEHFEVSKRTIMRDIDTLSESGVPIYALHGKGGGLSLMDGFILNKTAISEDEQNKILIALQTLRATDTFETEELLSRLGNLFNKSKENWIEVDYSAWGDRNSSDKLRFEKLRQAIVGSKAVKILYFGGSGEKTERVIYPLKLIYKDKCWYLAAFCTLREGYRIFRLSRIKKITVEEATFDRSKFSAPSLSDDDLPCEKIVIRFMPQMYYRVYDSFDESDIIEKTEDHITVAVDMPVEKSLYEFLISFGDGAEVLAPEKVRKELVKYIENLRKIYDTEGK